MTDGGAPDRSSSDRFREHWDETAPRFDKMIAPLEKRVLAASRDWVCSRAEGRVLEVAIGTGLNVLHYPDGVDLTGIEWSPAMLEITRRRVRELGRDVDLHLGDAAALPFDDASFDTVVITFSLCCIPDDDGALAEAARVLRPGGRLLLADHIVSSVTPVRWFQRLLDRFTVPRMGEHWTRRPLVELAAHGFDVVESERGTLGAIERVHARKPGD